jgi:signal transduction histidine kinase
MSMACGPGNPVGRRGRRRWLRIAGVSVTAALVLTALFAASGRTESVAETLRDALVHAAVMAALAGAGVPWFRARLGERSATVQWTVTLLFVVALAAASTVLSSGALVLAGARESFRGCFEVAFPINAVLGMTICTGMTLYESQRARLEAVTLELRNRELEHESVRKMALEARLASLESRLQPHFLFNTLNAISALIQEDPDQADRTLERLAALLRFSLDAAERGLVPLAHELKIVVDYLEIERTRLGERLTYTLDVTPEAAECEVPPLAVQTLVENSVKHAIAPRPGGGRVRVEAAVTGGHLVVSVWDDGPGFAAAALRPGHGLDNLQGRLAARFGATAALTIGRRDGGGVVTVSLPAELPAR